MAGKIVGIMGFSCNPPTRGHADLIMRGLAVCDEIVLVPSFRHPYGKALTPYDLRVEMAEAMLDDLGIRSRVQVSTIEQAMLEDDPVRLAYTADVMAALAVTPELADCRLAFLCGPDVLADIGNFHNHEQILDNWSVLGLPEVRKIRSTLVRNRLASGEGAEALVTPSVYTIIKQSGVYHEQ